MVPMVQSIFRFLNLFFNPEYLAGTDSLYDISKALKYHNIANMVVSIPEISATPLIFPAIAQSKTRTFYILERKNAESVFIYDLIQKEHKEISYEEFKMFFTGEILLIEKNDTDASRHSNLSKFNISDFTFHSAAIISVTTFYVLLFVFLLLCGISHLGIALYLLNGAGLGLSVAYLLHEHGIKNMAFDFICNHDQRKSTCISHNNIRFLSLSFSQLGAIYFFFNISGLFVLGMAGSFSSSTVLQSVLALLSILMVGISLYIQWIKNKTTCRLCMAINVVLIIHVFLIWTNAETINTDIGIIVGHIILGMMATGVVIMFSTNLTLKNEKNRFIIKENQIWPNKAVIERFLIENNDILIPTNPTLVLGSKDSTTQLVLIMHISCVHCEAAFGQMAQMLMMNDDTSLRLFIKYDDTPYHQKMMVRFKDACQSNHIRKAIHVFSEWKKGMYNDTKLDITELTESQVIKDNSDFFTKNKISTFPTILINGKMVPSFIDFAHIKVAYS